jgi:hypothetical protein
VLQNFVLPQLEEKEAELFQQDGAPLSFSNFVRAALNEKFPCCWMAEVTLLHRTPDFKSTDSPFKETHKVVM